MKRLPNSPLACLITTGETDTSNYQSRKQQLLADVTDAVYDGVQVLQIREKGLPGRLLFDLVQEVVRILERTDAVVFVNDRADIARAAGADGVHLPEAGLAPEVVKRIFPELLIGVSTHELAGAVRASAGGADLVYFGPVFETPGKGSPVGLDGLASVCREVNIPVIALGGIDDANVQSTINAGAYGIAAIRSLSDAEVRRRIFQQLRKS